MIRDVSHRLGREGVWRDARDRLSVSLSTPPKPSRPPQTR